MADIHFFVAVLPDGTEHNFEVRVNGGCAVDGDALARGCRDAVRAAKLTTPRSNPQQIPVDLFELKILGGKLVRSRVLRCLIDLPPERLANDELSAEMLALLADLPEEFQGYVSHESWDRGHSAGMEEVVMIARSIVDSLKPCIENYRKRLTSGSCGLSVEVKHISSADENSP